jgi:IS30 family transposase
VRHIDYVVRHINSVAGKKGFQPKLTYEQRQEILEMYQLGMPVVHIAAGAKVNRRTVQRVLARHKADEVKHKAEEKAAAFEAMCQRIAKKNKLDIAVVRETMRER